MSDLGKPVSDNNFDGPVPDVRQADLWLCWECHIPHLNVGQPRECTICGGELEYMGEVPYQNKELEVVDAAE